MVRHVLLASPLSRSWQCSFCLVARSSNKLTVSSFFDDDDVAILHANEPHLLLLSPTYTEQLCCWQLVVRPLMWLSNTGQHVAESRETLNFWQQVASPHQRYWQQSCSVYVGLYCAPSLDQFRGARPEGFATGRKSLRDYKNYQDYWITSGLPGEFQD